MIHAGYLISAYHGAASSEGLGVDAVIVGAFDGSTVKLLNNGVSEDVSEIVFGNDGDNII